VNPPGIALVSLESFPSLVRAENRAAIGEGKMKTKINAGQIGDLKIWVRTSPEMNGIFLMGQQTIFTGSVGECRSRANDVTPEMGFGAEIWCDDGEILRGDDFASIS
jgi:hypothetical protein